MKSYKNIVRIMLATFLIFFSLAALFKTTDSTKVFAQGNGCNTSVNTKYVSAGYGVTGACFNASNQYRHSSQSISYSSNMLRVYLSSSDGNSCNARAADSGYIWGTSVTIATSFASTLSCSHPPPYLGTGVHWIAAIPQFTTTSS